MRIFLIAVGVVIAALVAIAAFVPPTGQIRTEVEIAAPPVAVWAVLTSTADYRNWNPFIKSADGQFAVGNTVAMEMETPGGTPLSITPTIVVLDPQKELRWQGSLFLPRLFDGEHYFILEATETGTRLIHGEDFKGLLIPVARGIIEDASLGFEQMNEALKTRVEATGPFS